MTPVERAKALLGDSFKEDLEAHLLHGYVFSTPTLFAMGRPVPRGVDVYGPWMQWPIAACDAFFVWVAVGQLAELLSVIPFDLPWISWVRLGRSWEDIHWMQLEDLKKRACGSSQHLLSGAFTRRSALNGQGQSSLSVQLFQEIGAATDRNAQSTARRREEACRDSED
jgi:hypothetical protein